MNINLPKTRKEAKLNGNKIYDTQKICPHGHMSPRRTDSGACVECCSIARKELYLSGWRQKPNKVTAARKNKKWIDENSKQHWILRAVSRAKKRAKLSGVPFNITAADVENVIGNFCPIFGTEFKFIGNITSKHDSPSLDRIDCAQGYVIGNIEIISMKANVIKQNATSCEIFKVAEWLKTKGY